MKRISLKTCEEIIDLYTTGFGGEAITIEEGCLGLGKLLLHNAKGKKFIVIQERYLNEWSCYHTIRKYNNMPKKYKLILNKLK